MRVGALGDVLDLLCVKMAAAARKGGEEGENIILGMGADPRPTFYALAHSYLVKYSGGRGYRMSLKTEDIILCSACCTALSRAFASHSHCEAAGAEQMAQSGSILFKARGRDLEKKRRR